MLSVRINSAGYNESEKILNNISFDAESGKLILIGGHSGSGKTTLLFAITGVLTSLLKGWADGKVIYRSTDILKLDEPLSFSGKIFGFVLQDPDRQLLMPTPFDEVMFTLENFGFEESEAKKKTENLLETFGLKKKMFEHVENLSGGEKRRLSLASAIAHDPPIIIFDEPTASLDPWGINDVRNFIASEIRMGKSIIVVEHKVKYFIDMASELIVLGKNSDTTYFKDITISSKFLEKLDSLGVDSYPVSETKKKKDENRREKILEMRGVECWYDESDYILRNIDLDLRRGEVVALVGPNGSGKTTLLKTIAGFHKKYSGEIKIYAERKNVKPFYVPQVPDYLFIKNTLKEELEFLSKKTGKRKDELIALLDFYESRKNSSPYTLSLGQRRWLSAVIAWSYEPSIVLFDEPTVGLDKFMLFDFFSNVIKLKEKGTSFLISTHDPRVLSEIADRAYATYNGSIKEVDPIDEAKKLETISGVSHGA
ncbi:ATP-binding cassette domain-containing protein [Fervidicoccus fontis]|uniref:ATP-binding cassette domain-containing protein n=1 Tax=Fervidicoccus fontis TaxID=683846 RepID=A0A843AHX0_9CREN|nr:ABC transporter ATP-binding protein [Fervidicoccus fontis]MBE9391179.1 ATP-binding cassette domain-containing protein [Fervidicoccus fontis]